jgi:hypothetical protein
VDGTVRGVTGADGADGRLVPALLEAVTVNVYAVPLVSPEIVPEVAPAVATVLPPGLAVTVYPVITDPPALAGAVQETAATLSPAVAATAVGFVGRLPMMASAPARISGSLA